MGVDSKVIRETDRTTSLEQELSDAKPFAPRKPKIQEPLPEEQKSSPTAQTQSQETAGGASLGSAITGNSKEEAITTQTESPLAGPQNIVSPTVDPASTATPAAQSHNATPSELKTETLDKNPQESNEEPSSVQSQPLTSNVKRTFSGFMSRAQSFFSRISASKPETQTVPAPQATNSPSPSPTSTETSGIKEDTAQPSSTEPNGRLARQLTAPVPLETSLFSASALHPPSIHDTFLTTPGAALVGNNILLRIPWINSPDVPTSKDLIAYYSTQVRKHRPIGIDEKELKGLWEAWLKIQKWTNEEMTETAVRRCARMTLAKAAEIVEVRKEEREKRAEEDKAVKDKEKSVLDAVLGGKDKIWYPLTQTPTKTEENISEESDEKKVKEVTQKLDTSTTEEKAPPRGALTNLDPSKVELRKMPADQRNQVLAELNKIAENNEPLPEQPRRWLVDMEKPLPPQLPPAQPRDYSHRV
jgi:hypothetical protein